MLSFFLGSCGEEESAKQFHPGEMRRKKDTLVYNVIKIKGIRTRRVKKAVMRPVDGFDFPVGPPDGRGYFKARGIIPGEHYGEDWNGSGGKNTDFGDLVYAVADGVVFYAKDYRPGWGQVVRILHNYGTPQEPKYVESLYAHLASTWVKKDNFLKRGDPIGTIGSADGIYHAHLHFEMRDSLRMSVRWTEKGDTSHFLDPTAFINAHRPKDDGKPIRPTP